MPCCHPLRALRVSTFAVLLVFCAVSCGTVRLGQDNAQRTIPITSVHPLLNVPPERGLRPTLAGEGLPIAHAAHERNFSISDYSISIVFLLRAAGVGWALPNIRSLIDHDAVSATKATELAHIDWLVPLTSDPWPDGLSEEYN